MDETSVVTVRGRVFEIISRVLGTPAELVTEQMSPESVEAWDSLMHMKLILALEEEFNVQFTDERIVEMLSVEAIISAVAELSPIV